MRRVKSGGGWPAVWYALRKAREAGGWRRLWKAMRTRNACKTCALGMGGQRGGMVNETGHFPEVCKKSLQAMVADMQGAIDPDFWQQATPDMLKRLSPRELESRGRLTQPVLYTAQQRRFQPISWDDALDRIVHKLAALEPNKTFWYFSGRSSNEAGFLLQLFARLYGTNNVNNCSYYCHQASGVGLTSTIGSGTATIVLEDLDRADLAMVIGANPASNHPRLMRSLMRLRRRGGEVIVVNPIVETGLARFKVPSDPRSLLFGSKIASLYVQPHIGGDLALLTGVAKQIVETDAHDTAFLESSCAGWPELREQIERTPWEEIVAKSGVSRDQIADIARLYARSRGTVFFWAMGITHHLHGVRNVQAIANLALLRAMVGRPGAGLAPIRGHSNVQGIGSVGVTPKLRDMVFERLENQFGIKLPTAPGLDTMQCMEAASGGDVTFGFCLGGNLYGSNPDATFAGRALGNLDMIVYLNTTLNTGHARGLARQTIILPVLARDEEPQPTTQESMFNYVRLSDGGQRRHQGPHSEVDVVASIAEGVFRLRGNENRAATSPAGSRHQICPIDWSSMRNTRNIRSAISDIIPGYEQAGRIDESREEFQIGGRTFHAPRFATPDGRARLHTYELPPLLGTGEGQLRLMTIRSEGQFNTVVYEDQDVYRGTDRRHVILVHPEDLRRLNLDHATTATVRGPAGSLPGVYLHRFEEIRPGNAAMYFPEANALVGRTIDPDSKTPAFKGVVVTLEAEA